MTPLSIFDPVNPATVSVACLKQRTGLLLAAMERGEVPDMPVAPGSFRCFTCRRESVKGQSDEDAEAEYRRRFGGEPDPGTPFILCDDCNRIIAQDQGVPLLCPSGPRSRGLAPPARARLSSRRLPRRRPGQGTPAFPSRSPSGCSGRSGRCSSRSPSSSCSGCDAVSLIVRILKRAWNWYRSLPCSCGHLRSGHDRYRVGDECRSCSGCARWRPGARQALASARRN
jgi:hypothetical protein